MQDIYGVPQGTNALWEPNGLFLSLRPLTTVGVSGYSAGCCSALGMWVTELQLITGPDNASWKK